MASDGVFRSLAESKHLKEQTILTLLDQDYDSEEALSTLQEADLDALGFKRAQRGLLKAWVEEIRSRPQCVGEGGGEQGSTAGQGSLGEEGRQGEEGCLEGDSGDDTRGDTEPDTSCDLEPDVEGSADVRLPADGQEDLALSPELPALLLPADVDLDQDLDELPEIDMDKCINNLHITDQMRAEICKHVEEQGVLGLERLLGDKLLEFMACAVNLAVVGRSGTGKSSLINSLRNLRARDSGAAKVGVTETTVEVAPFIHPVINKVILWDLPGVNTPKFPRETYLEDVEFPKYDAFIIVCTDRVTEDDVWLAQEAHSSDRPFYFVRTKIDMDVMNNERDGGMEEELLLKSIRDKIGDSLSTAGLPRDQVFLISSVLNHQTNWDFSRMTEHLTTQTPPKNRTAMVMAMVSCSKEIILMKKKELDDRIETVALSAASSPEGYEEVVLEEIKMYTERFGITDLDMEKWKIDVKRLEPELQQIKQALDSMLVRLSLQMTAAQFLLGGVGLLLEVFGISNIYKRWVKQVLQKCEDVKAEACTKTAELKRQAARQTLYVALESCTKFAYGVLEARKFIPERGEF